MAEKFVLTAQLNTQLNVASVQATIRQLRSQLQSVTVNLNVTGASQVNKQMQQVAASTEKVNTNVKKGRDIMGDFGKAGALAAKRFAAFSIATAGFIAFVSAIRNGAKAAIDFERQMIRISQVTGVSMGGLKDLKDTITDLSKGLGVSSEKLVDISRVLSQTGMSARDTKIALEALAKTELAPTFTNIQKTTEAAIAAMRQFNIEAGKLEQTLGQMNALAANFAVEADDLGVVIRRAGGAFKSAGGDLLELESLFTSVRSTTRESAETIATGFRTIFTRLRRPKTIGYLKELGINLEDMTGKFVGPYEAVRRLNTALSDLDPRDTRYAAIIEELGGFRQVSKVIPLIQQFEKAELARATAMRGSASLTKDALSAQDALAVRLIKVKESFADLMRQMMDSKGIQLFIDMSLRLAEALIKIASALEPLIPLIAVLGAGALFKGGGRLLAGASSGLGFAKGGMVPGTGNTDSVPAMLTPGEFVIRKGAASRLGSDQLNSMNRYAAGGVVRSGRHYYGNGKKKSVNAPVDLDFSTANPQIAGFFLKPEKGKADTKDRGRIQAKGKKKKIYENLLEAGKTRALGLKMDAKGVPNIGKVNYGLQEEYVDPKLTRNFYDITKDAMGNAVEEGMKLFGNIRKDPLGKKARSRILRGIGLDDMAGKVFDGTIQGVSGFIQQGGPGARWDFALQGGGGKGKLRRLERMFGQDKDAFAGLRFADAKLTNTTSSRASIGDKVTSVASELSVKAMAKGGVVDSVPAMLTPGEFVINKSSAQAIGYGNLKGMNKYAAGGIVRKGRHAYGRFSPTPRPAPLATVEPHRIMERRGVEQSPEKTKGGDKLGMLFAADMVLSFATTLVDAESTIGKTVNSLVNVITGYIAVMAILESETVKTILTEKMKGGMFEKFGSRMAKFGALAVGAALIFNEAGKHMKEAGMETLKASKGKEGATMVAAGGAVSAGGMGAAAGFMVAGPWGAAIGAVIGGIWGWVNAMKEAKDQIAMIKIDEGMKGFDQAMRDVELGFREVGTLGPDMAAGLHAIDMGMHGSAKVREKATQEAKRSFASYNKTIQEVSKESLSLSTFFTKIPESSLRTFAKLNDIPYEKLEKQIVDQIEANKAAAESTRKLNASMQMAEDINRSMASIDSAVSSATASMHEFGNVIDAISGKGKAFDLEKGVISRPGLLAREERSQGGRMDREIASIASILQGRRNELQTQASEEMRLLSQVTDAVIASRAEIARQGATGKKPDEVLREELERRAGPPVGPRSPAQQDAVDKIMAGIKGATKDKLGEAIGGPGAPGDMDKIMKGAERDIKRELDTLKRLAKFINAATKEFEKAYSARAKLEMELVKETKKLVDLQKERFVKMKKLRAGGGVGAGSITPEESEAFFQRKQAAALGGVGMQGLAPGGQVDVGALSKKFRDLGKSIAENQKKLGQSSSMAELGNQNHLERQRALIETIKQEETQRKVLTDVIKDFQNVQQRTAALQEKINQLNQQAAKRRSMVDQYAGATDESRAEMDRVADMARRIADGTEQFSNVPQEMRGQVISFIQDMASQGGPIGDKFMGAAGDIRVQTARDLGINLTADQEKQLRAQPTSEVQKLTEAVDKAYKDAISLQNEAIIGGVKDTIDRLKAAITDLSINVATELKKVLLQEDIATGTEESRQLVIANRHLTSIVNLLTNLNKEFGIDVEDPAVIKEMSGIPAAIDRHETAVRSAGVFLQAAVRQGSEEVHASRGTLSSSVGGPSWQRTQGFGFNSFRVANTAQISGLTEDERRGSRVLDTKEGAKKFIEARAKEQVLGTLKAQGVDMAGIDASMKLNDITRELKKEGRLSEKGYLLDKKGQATGVKPADITKMVEIIRDLKKEVETESEGSGMRASVLGDVVDPRKPGLRAPWGSRAIGSDSWAPSATVDTGLIDARIAAVLGQEGMKRRKAEGRLFDTLENKITAIMGGRFGSEQRAERVRKSGLGAETREQYMERREALKKELTGDYGADPEKRAIVEGLTKDDTLSKVQTQRQKNTDAIKSNTDMIDANNKLLDAIKLEQDKIKGDVPGAGRSSAALDVPRGKPGELPGGMPSDAIVSTDLPDPSLQDRVNKSFDTIGSAYVHDVHVEAAINNLLGGGGGGSSSEMDVSGSQVTLSNEESSALASTKEMADAATTKGSIWVKMKGWGKDALNFAAQQTPVIRDIISAQKLTDVGSDIIGPVGGKPVTTLTEQYGPEFITEGLRSLGETPGPVSHAVTDSIVKALSEEEEGGETPTPGSVEAAAAAAARAPISPESAAVAAVEAMRKAMMAAPGGMQGLMAGLPLPLPVTIAGFGAGGFGDMMGGAGLGGASGGIMGTGISWNPLDWIGKPFGLGSADEGPGPAERAGAKMGLRSRVAGPGGFTPAGKGVGHPDMEKWTKSMTSLSTQMGAFTEAFQGGMVWTIEGTHDINVNLNGAEVFGTLSEMFSGYVMNKTGDAIKEYLKTFMPQLGILSGIGGLLDGGRD